MQSKNLAEDKICYDGNCRHNIPYLRSHIHVRTPNGEYVRFIIDKNKIKVHNHITDQGE